MSGTDNKQRKLQAGGYNGLLSGGEREIDLRGERDECREIQRWRDRVLSGRGKFVVLPVFCFYKACHKNSV